MDDLLHFHPRTTIEEDLLRPRSTTVDPFLPTILETDRCDRLMDDPLSSTIVEDPLCSATGDPLRSMTADRRLWTTEDLLPLTIGDLLTSTIDDRSPSTIEIDVGRLRSTTDDLLRLSRVDRRLTILDEDRRRWTVDEIQSIRLAEQDTSTSSRLHSTDERVKDTVRDRVDSKGLLRRTGGTRESIEREQREGAAIVASMGNEIRFITVSRLSVCDELVLVHPPPLAARPRSSPE